jgi:hypothetical protein
MANGDIFAQNGNTFPSLVPESVQQELIDYCHQCVLALGFYKGTYKHPPPQKKKYTHTRARVRYCFGVFLCSCMHIPIWCAGVFHMEAIYTEKGPMLIECNPRVGVCARGFGTDRDCVRTWTSVSALLLAAPRHLFSLPTLKTTAFAAFCFLDDPALQHFQAIIEIPD